MQFFFCLQNENKYQKSDKARLNFCNSSAKRTIQIPRESNQIQHKPINFKRPGFFSLNWQNIDCMERYNNNLTSNGASDSTEKKNHNQLDQECEWHFDFFLGLSIQCSCVAMLWFYLFVFHSFCICDRILVISILPAFKPYTHMVQLTKMNKSHKNEQISYHLLHIEQCFFFHEQNVHFFFSCKSIAGGFNSRTLPIIFTAV